jgi:hypothetical protein
MIELMLTIDPTGCDQFLLGFAQFRGRDNGMAHPPSPPVA